MAISSVNIDIILYKGYDNGNLEIIDEVIFDLDTPSLTKVSNYLKSKGYNVDRVKISQFHWLPTIPGHIRFYINMLGDHRQSNEVLLNRMSKLKNIFSDDEV